MLDRDSHLSDQDLLLYLEGELTGREAKTAGQHLADCGRCRARSQELEQAVEDFTRVHQEGLDAQLPPPDGPRALLRAQMARLVSAAPARRLRFALSPGLLWAGAAALCAVLSVAWWLAGPGLPWRAPARPRPLVSIPDSSLTPGATLLLSRQTVCSQENVKNKAVPAALQRRVFEEYGMSRAEWRAYEVDYLVTPALGGADDIHNLWPQSYSAEWNARVKDALEDRLRELVCNGSLELSQAQREIADNWVGAYKKYFHTDMPLEEHRRLPPDKE